jgi:hypothetical protein
MLVLGDDRMDDVETVFFIVSFYIGEQSNLGNGRSLSLIRDYKWEALVAEDDKGVRVSDEEENKVKI